MSMAALGPRTSAGASRDAFIAADVGGTHTRVGLVRAGGPGECAVTVLAHDKYRCAEYPSLAAIIGDFRARQETGAGCARVVIACAGVVLGDAVINSNLPWKVSLTHLRQELGIEDVLFINDFQAAAHAAQCMAVGATALLTPGIDAAPAGPVLVIGPGTGLGAAVRIPHRDGTVVLPTEAGHTAFAPGNAREIEILRWMQRRGGHVATEQLVSGPGLVNLYDAIRAIDGGDGVESALRAPPAITRAASNGDAAAREAVLTFCGLLGSVIGDLLMVTSARSVFIAGGILPQLKEVLPDSQFHARLCAKGAMRPVLEGVPVRLIENEQLGVVGAASWYLEQLKGPPPRDIKTPTQDDLREDGTPA